MTVILKLSMEAGLFMVEPQPVKNGRCFHQSFCTDDEKSFIACPSCGHALLMEGGTGDQKVKVHVLSDQETLEFFKRFPHLLLGLPKIAPPLASSTILE